MTRPTQLKLKVEALIALVEADKKAFWTDFKLFGAPVITGSQVASPADKQTNLGDVVNEIHKAK